MLPIVLYRCEIWSLTQKKELRLRVSENRMLRRIFGPKREEVAGDGRRLHNEELHKLNDLSHIWVIKSRVRWVGQVVCMGGEMRAVYKVLVRKPEGMRPLGKPRCRLEWILGK